MNIEATKCSTGIFYYVSNIDDATVSSTSLSYIISILYNIFIEIIDENYNIPLIKKEIDKIQNEVEEIFKKWTIKPKEIYFQNIIEKEKDKILSILIKWIPNNKLLKEINNEQKVEKQIPIKKQINKNFFQNFLKIFSKKNT